MDANTFSILVLLGSFILMIILRFPIAFAVGISSVLCLLSMGSSLTVVAQQMVKGVYSFSLMAVPFFILMGGVMGAGGISDRLVGLANALVGWMRGGLGMVNCVDSFFFGGISGSAAADTASLGSILIPIMVDQGYDPDFSTALTISSSVQGILVPPSHNMVIYSTAAGGLSVASLFLAGYVPGALLMIALMACVFFIARAKNYPRGDKFNIVNILKHLWRSIGGLLAVLIVVVGVVAGYFTATEAAAIAVIYSMIVSLLIYRGTSLKGIWKIFGEAIETLSIVLILIATSGLFGYCLTLLNVPALAANAIMDVTTNKILLALLINLILLILGAIMDMAPIILIATPILLPVAGAIGIDPVQFGIIMMLNCGIGLLTPPVGSVLFIGSAISKVPIEKLVKANLPFYAIMFVVLMLLTFVPQFSLAFPSMFGYTPSVTPDWFTPVVW